MSTDINRREAIRRTTFILGGALTAGTIASIMTGCERQVGIDWTPEFFTEDQAKTISAMAETVFPKTETPGAADAGVGSYIDLTLKNHWAEDRRKVFLNGLDDFMSTVKTEYKKSFDRLSPSQQNLILTQTEKASKEIMDNRIEPKNLPRTAIDWQGKPFFRQFKELACAGYFSSEAVAKNYFTYNPIPGDYTGCVDLAEIGAQWAF